MASPEPSKAKIAQPVGAPTLTPTQIEAGRKADAAYDIIRGKRIRTRGYIEAASYAGRMAHLAGYKFTKETGWTRYGVPSLGVGGLAHMDSGRRTLLPAGRPSGSVARRAFEARQRTSIPIVGLPPPPSPQEESKWKQEAIKAKIPDTFAYIQERWLATRGLTARQIASAGKLMPGVTKQVKGVVVAEAARPEITTKAQEAMVSDIKKIVEATPPPTAKQESAWTEEARRLGVKDKSAYIQQRWLGVSGLLPEHIAMAGKLMPGVTRLGEVRVVGKRVIAEPPVVAEKPRPELTKVAQVAQKQTFERKNIKLPDGNWIDRAQFNELPKKYRTIGLNRGYDAMARAIGVGIAEQKRYDKMVSDITPFRTEVGKLGPGEFGPEVPEGLKWQYDIAGFIRRHPENIPLVKEFFPPNTAGNAIKFNKEMEKSAKTEELYREQPWLNIRTGDVITAEERTAIISLHPQAQDEYVKQQPALLLPVDPKWQELKDRTKSDPERVAYVRQWQDKMIDFATAVSIAATPYTMGVIGAVGKFLTIPKVATWAFNIGRVGVKPLALAATIVNIVPRGAVALGKLVALGPTILGASRLTDEIRVAQLQTDWQTFENLAPTAKDDWTDKAGYGKPFSQLNDNQKSVVLLQYSNPPETTRQEWLENMGEKIGALTFYASEKAEWLQEHSPAPISNPATFLGGTAVGVLEGMGYMASIPILSASLLAAVPVGAAPVMFAQTVRGMAEFFTKELPLAFALNPVLATGRVTGLFLLSPQAALKLAKSGIVRGFPRYVPERAMALEYSTVRIRFDKIAEFASLARAERIKIAEQIVTRLLKGEKKVTIKGITATIEIRNVPYQEVVGNSLWNFSNRPLEAGSKVYTSPQAAIRFGIAEAGGKLVKGTTLNEVRVPDNFMAKMEKLLGKGEAELESIFGKNIQYEPIPGWTGKGISTNVLTGPYKIRRFTILGEATIVKKLTPATLARIRLEAGKAALGDLIKGWSGRMDALREIFKVDPRVGRLEKAISRLKTEKPYVATADNVKAQRASVPHPDLKGELKTRTKIITYNKARDAVFLGLDRSAPSFELMGGSANPKEILLQTGRWHNFTKSGKPLNWGEAARSQVLGESNMRMPSKEYIGTYLGKVNDNALHGARIYEGRVINKPDIVAAWNKYQRQKFSYKTPELKAGVWLLKDGTVRGVAGLKTSVAEAVRLFNELGINPATKDILGYVVKKDGFRIGDVKVDRSNKWLLKARDKGFVNRAIENKPLTVEQIANINKAEIKFLRQRRMDIAKGAEPMILDYLTAEGGLGTVAELLHGRQKTVTIKLNEPLRQKMDTAIVELLKKDTRPVAKVAKDLLAKGKTKEAVKAYEKVISAKSRAELYNRLKQEAEEAVKVAKERVYDQYGEYIYRPEVYSRQYTAWLQRYLAAALARRPLDLVRAREGATPTSLSRLIVEAREFDRPFIPVRIEPTRPGIKRATPTRTTVARVTTREVPGRIEPPRVLPPRRPPIRKAPPKTPPRRPPPTTKIPIKTPPRLEPPEQTVLGRVQISGKRAKLPDGSVTFKQGWTWKWIPREDFHDGIKPRSLPKGITPIGARFTHLRTPEETIQMIGDPGASVPDISIDLGVADILITDQAQTIRYTGKGEETVVGERIATTTKGMSIPATGISRPDIGTVTPATSINRTAISATSRPPRKGKRTEPAVRGINRPEVVEERKRVEEERIASEKKRGVYKEPATGLYFDEDPEWLAQFNGETGNKPVNRATMSKKAPKRKGQADNKPTVVRGIRQ